MNASELLRRLNDDLPAAEDVELAAFLEDTLLPHAMSPGEPVAFALACTQAVWGLYGPRN
jgi:hypothetical protein